MLIRLFDKITRLSLRFRWVILVISLIILAAGVYSVVTLNLELLPRIEFPQTVVVAQWADAESSDQFLEEITIPLEELLGAVDGVVNVESTTSNSFAFIILRNEFGLDQDKIVEDIKEAVATLALPEGVETPQVINFSLSDLPVVVASASSGDLSLPELKDLVTQELQPRLEKVNEISQVTISGGQELPAEEPVVETEPEPEDPGRLPFVVIQGAKALGVDIEYAQDVTPEFLADLGVSGSDEQILAVLRLIPPETLPYAPPETLAILPKEYMSELDPDLQAELDELAVGFGGINQYNLAEAMAFVRGDEPAAEATATVAPSPTVPAVVDEGTVSAEEPATMPAIDLPEEWVAAAAQAGQELATTADITPEVMQGIANFAPQLLGSLEPEMWRLIDPAAVAIALPAVEGEMDSELLIQLEAIRLAANGEETPPVALPESWIQAAGATGFVLATTADLPPEALEMLASSAPVLLGDLTGEMVLAFTPEQRAVLPEEFFTEMDQGLLDTLDIMAIYAAMASADVAGQLPEVEPVPLPESWTAAAAQFGQELATTADLTPQVMGGLVAAAPDLLGELEPSMWRAMDPAVVALALPAIAEDLDPSLLGQLYAIRQAEEGEESEPVELPISWVQAAGATGVSLESTGDITQEAIEMLSAAAPQLLSDLSEEMILAFTPDVQAALPDEFIVELDDGLQETLAIIAIRHAAFMVAEAGLGQEVTEATPEPEATPDPARLPDILIQGAQSFGLDIEVAGDIEPDFMRQIGAFGPQGLQILQMLTPGNLVALQPEVIGLLPPDFVDQLDDNLKAELDDLASEYGGAGQLAMDEAAAGAGADEVADENAPQLSGIWLEPGPNGEPSQFQTAADILNNGFVPSAALFLNFFPESPQVENPVEWMSALTPEIMAYLADNEEGFAAELAPQVLEMMSPETLTFLLETYPEAFDADLTERLSAIAAGTATAFIPEASITRTDGNPSLILNLFKDGDANTVEVAHRVFDELAAYESENPEVTFKLVFEQASFIEDSIQGVAREGLLGALFAIVIILIFLSGRVGGKYKLSWRSTIVVGMSIPLSVFSAFLLMRVIPPTLGVWINDLADSTGNGLITFVARLFPTSVTLNIMTLSGMTVAVGRVVDDSIVVLENIYRFIQKGDDPKTAAISGTREVAIAIFASTATTVAVFLPLGLLGGLIGSFFLPFGLTVTYALAASFFVAITVVPALAFLLIRKEHIPEERETAMQRRYTPILEWSLHHRGYTMAIATVIFVLSLFLLQQLPRSFIPAIGEPTVNVTAQLPDGTTMAATDELVREFEGKAAGLAGVETVQTEVGSGGGFEAFFGGGGISQNVANATVSVESQDDLEALTTRVRDEAEAIFGPENVTVSAASQTGFGGFSLIVTGDSMEELMPAVADIEAALAAVDIDGNGRPDIVNISSNVAEGATNGNGTIIRIDGRPAVSFRAELETDNTLGVTANAKEQVAAVVTLPESAEVTEGFESEQQTRGFQEMVTAIIYSIVIVYIIMALTFRSLIHPFTILFSLPFALVGAALALFVSGSVLGISAMIGIMMLVGIVVTNAIVLLELVQQLRTGGNDAYKALVRGGRTRLRPIWMTALAAALALLPLAISRESGAIIASELAITVIGGLLVSTALTLLVVPVVYSLFDSVTNRLRRRKVEA